MRNALHGGSAGADNADALVAEPVQPPFAAATGVIVVPAAGMEGVALEMVDAGNSGQLGPGQQTIGHHHIMGADPVTAVG